jgi:cyanate permease
VIRDNLHHLHHTIDDQALVVRVGIILAALAALPLFGTGVQALGSALAIGQLVLPLLVVAHVPAVVALIAIWSIGCDVCRPGGST